MEETGKKRTDCTEEAVEIWKPVVTHVGFYEVSNIGRVKRLATTTKNRNQSGVEWDVPLPEIIMKANKDSKGYYQLCLNLGGKRTARVHRLVAEAFLNPPNEGVIEENLKAGINKAFVNHIDRNIENNCVTNLEWCTVAYNNRHGYVVEERIANVKGSLNYKALLNEEQVTEILKLLAEGKLSQEKIGALYGVSQLTISNIATGRSWAWFTGIARTPRSCRKPAKSLSLSNR